MKQIKKTKKTKKESDKLIDLEKEKIKESKQKIKEIKRNKFRSTKFYKKYQKIIKFIISDKDNYTFSEVLVVTFLSLMLGAFSCYVVFCILTGSSNIFKVGKDTKKFNEAYETIIDNYYGNVEKEELIEGAISGMMNVIGDNYTVYSNSAATENFNEQVNGTYQGIGATIQKTDKGIIVIDIYTDSPADKAGLKVGDIITAVDELELEKIEVTSLAEYIKTKENNNVTMTVKREDKEEELLLVRDKVETPAVDSEIYEQNGKKIGYIKISLFSSVASKQFKTHIKKLEKGKIEGLVIDVRDNNGGYLTTVVDIANELLPKGKAIYQIKKDNKITTYKDKTKTSRNYPIAILVNGNSASASEILAGAIKESYEGYVVGTKTFGKGTVQQVRMLSDGSMIKYTIENWLSPKGNWIDKIGVTPTHTVAQSQEYYQESTPQNDAQLNKALELISK